MVSSAAIIGCTPEGLVSASPGPFAIRSWISARVQDIVLCEPAPEAKVADGALEGLLQVLIVDGEFRGRVVQFGPVAVGTEDNGLLVHHEIGPR